MGDNKFPAGKVNYEASIVNVNRETQDFLEFIETNKTSDEYNERLNNDV